MERRRGSALSSLGHGFKLGAEIGENVVLPPKPWAASGLKVVVMDECRALICESWLDITTWRWGEGLQLVPTPLEGSAFWKINTIWAPVQYRDVLVSTQVLSSRLYLTHTAEWDIHSVDCGYSISMIERAEPWASLWFCKRQWMVSVFANHKAWWWTYSYKEIWF